MFVDGRGNWTERGCNLTGISEEASTVTCSCNHLTNFAILVVRNAPLGDVLLNNHKWLRKYSLSRSSVSCDVVEVEC